MSQSIVILGRQPAIGLAELESLYGAERVTPLGRHGALLSVDPQSVAFARLGGSVKLAKLLTILDFTNWQQISDYLLEHVPKHTCCIGEGKLTFGLSVYDVKVNDKAIERTALEIKKAVRASDNRPVRVVPTKNKELTSAQVLHNKMTHPPLGMELILVRNGGQTYLAQTVSVQDIDAYAARDQARPKRDARVGMLPPKLAQIIVNLAAAKTDASLETSVLDPFCGTGVVLQEAALMGYNVYGSDIEERMIDFSHENLLWVSKNNRTSLSGLDADQVMCQLAVCDATNFSWQPTPDLIACETYLGRPFSHTPTNEVLEQVMSDVNTIHKKFLQNVARQTSAGFRMCLAVPAWKIAGKFTHLPTLDHLKELGYTRVSFKRADHKDLIYHREGQIVGRELVTLVRT